MPRIALLADGHLTSDDPSRLEILVRTLTDLPEDTAAVYILGDLFEVWLGVARRQAHVEQVAEALAGLRRRGVKLGYVEGNRDFRIARGPYRDLFDVASADKLVERFGSRTLHLTHGDLINTADRQYRAWRLFAKHALAPAALTLLPDKAAVGLGHRLERRLRTTNIKHKGYFPTEACRAYTRAALREGADVVVAGHFHQAVRLEVEDGARRGLFISLPFWHAEPRIVWIDENGRVEGLMQPGASPGPEGR